MLDPCHEYAAASTDLERSLYAAAGEAVLATGVHAGSNAFVGFLLPNIGGIIVSLGMLRGEIFGRVTAYLGLVGSVLISIYVIMVTFVHGAISMVTIPAAPRGILLMLWMVLFARKLLKLAGAGTAA